MTGRARSRRYSKTATRSFTFLAAFAVVRQLLPLRCDGIAHRPTIINASPRSAFASHAAGDVGARLGKQFAPPDETQWLA
jgi:hypothetical protein